MSWEHDHYDVLCKSCGYTGKLTISSDDWNRTEASWQGFEGIKTNLFNPAASWAKCLKCGKDAKEIEITRAK